MNRTGIKIHCETGNRAPACRSRGGRLDHSANKTVVDRQSIDEATHPFLHSSPVPAMLIFRIFPCNVDFQNFHLQCSVSEVSPAMLKFGIFSFSVDFETVSSAMLIFRMFTRSVDLHKFLWFVSYLRNVPPPYRLYLRDGPAERPTTLPRVSQRRTC